MKHTSRRFGEFTYEENQIITFPSGLLGFPNFKRFVLKSSKDTAPMLWLLSVDDGGPELALIDPEDVSKEYTLADVPIDDRVLDRVLHAEDTDELLRLAVVTLPENIKQMSMNLRTPILIDRKTHRGVQYPPRELNKKPVRCMIYRDLISSRPEDHLGMLVMLRKKNETLEIGDEITVHVLDFDSGGVRLAVTAPKNLRVSRGRGKVTPKCETKRADETMDVSRLKGLMKMHRVMQAGGERLPETLESATEDKQIIGL